MKKSKVFISNMSRVFFKFHPKNTRIRQFWSGARFFYLVLLFALNYTVSERWYCWFQAWQHFFHRSNSSKVFLWKGVLEICSKFTGEHPCRIMIWKSKSNFFEIKLLLGRSPVNLMHVFRTPFHKNILARMLECISFQARSSSKLLK